MNVYLDASVLVALFTRDPFTQRADGVLRGEGPVLAVSDFAERNGCALLTFDRKMTASATAIGLTVATA